MRKSKVILLLGTNLGDRDLNLKEALNNIENEVGEIVSKSEIKETEPVGFTAEIDFYNQLLEVLTYLSPIDLLNRVKQIESRMGRVYTTPKQGEKYVSRIIDIDILFYNDLNFQSSVLTIPHPQTENRKFVKLMLNRFSFEVI
ncbi:2-amino-4-hydroxy-6-hydroxymethyldihydropteridine diphosphokinase [Weeksellaceae bacterium TAE3-ERU29]|nr:2-amino-4-hydroxy-6-hydroxymethyldihydropteridine diphosphokinase [Weeksellaceae bacterium TAE3-ERU29]